MSGVFNYIRNYLKPSNEGEIAADSSEPAQKEISPEADRKRRMEACMVLAGVGDAIGYNDGKWEFCPSGERIQRELGNIGGITRLKPTKHRMIVSDDTVMHIATAEAILSESASPDEEYCALAREYKKCMKDMGGRAPGLTCMSSVKMLKPDTMEYTIPFNRRGGGCGAAMRAVPIGLLYWRPEEVGSLVRVAIEAGRMTHNHPTGFLGSVAVALFVSYAIQGKEVREWGEGLLHTLHTARQYCEEQKRDWELIRDNWAYFKDQWSEYIFGDAMQSVDRDLSASEYDEFVKSVSFMGTGGASGHDAPMIAYDAILRCYKVVDSSSRWEKLCRYGMFHGGDSDSTGIVAGACYGAMYGLEGVPINNYRELEYRDRLEGLGGRLYYRDLEAFRKDNSYRFPSGSLSRRERSLDSTREFPNRKSAGKKRVTFEDEATDVSTDRSPLRYGRKEVVHDLFSLNSMENNRNRIRVSNIPDSKSISQRRSHSYSPPRNSRIPDTHICSDSYEKAYHLRMTNINNYSHFSTTTKPSNLQNKYNPTSFDITHSKDIPNKSNEYITPSPRSFSQPITDTKYRTGSYIKQSTIERTIHYPPNYSHKSELQHKSSNIIPRPIAHSYGGCDN